MIKAKLIKLESISNLPDEKIYVKDGQIVNGVFDNWPSVGTSFVFSRPDGRTLSQTLPIITSTVEEIIDERTFKTKNSIYKIVTQEDEREEKIKIIIS
jgi:hypothetical protein